MNISTKFESYEEAYPEGIERSFWHLARNRIIHRFASQAGPVLEIGCGPGLVVQALRAKGMDCWGCDIGDPRVEGELRRFLYLGLDALDLPDATAERFEQLMLCDVIEHLPDPVAFMRALAAKFPNAERLIVTVPARQELWSNYDEHYGHYRRYDRKSLEAEISAAGFEPLRSRYFFHALYPAARALLFLKTGRETVLHPPRQPGLHGLVAKYFTLEWALAPDWLWGTSLIASARKQTLPNRL